MVYTTKRDREGAKDVGDVRMARRMRRAGNIVTWDDVDATTSTDGPTAIELPPWLLRDRVFEYLVAPPIVYVTDGVADPKRYERALGPLRAVCQQWQKLVQFLLKEARLRVETVEINRSEAKVLKRILKEAAKTGPVVEELTLTMTLPWYCYTGRHFDAASSLGDSWWSLLFQSYSNVLRLDLSTVPIGLLQEAIVAVGSCCISLQALIICSRPLVISATPQEETTASIIKALKQWYESNGGLRALTVSWWVREYAALRRAVVEAVTAFCPRIEYFDEYQSSTGRLDILTQPALPLDVWTRFRMSCTRLRKLTCFTDAWTREDVRAVIAAPKPCLERAMIYFAETATWPIRYFPLILELLETSPRLRVLDLKFHYAMTPTSRIPWDGLARVISTHCSDLEIVRIIIHDAQVVPAKILDALSGKRLIREVCLNPVKLTDGALTTFLRNTQSASKQPLQLRLQSMDMQVAATMLLQSLEGDATFDLTGAILDCQISRSQFTDPQLLPTDRRLLDRIKRRYASADFRLEVAATKLRLRINYSQLRVA